MDKFIYLDFLYYPTLSVCPSDPNKEENMLFYI